MARNLRPMLMETFALKGGVKPYGISNSLSIGFSWLGVVSKLMVVATVFQGFLVWWSF